MPNDGERLIKLETQMENFEKKIDAQEISRKENHAELKELITTFIKDADTKYAAKWIEKPLLGTAGIVGTAIIVALLTLIIK